MKGDLVDLHNSFLGIADNSVQVLTECLVACIPADAIKTLAFKGAPRGGLEGGVNRGELLQALHLPEESYRPLSSSKRQMRVLHPVVCPAADLLLLVQLSSVIAALYERRPSW
jgi:hypothetical protein